MEFYDKYMFLSNFYPATVIVPIGEKQMQFENVEAAVQAAKNPEYAEYFQTLRGLEAKNYGKRIKSVYADWNVKEIMYVAIALHSKFSDAKLFKKLKEIKSNIIHNNYWGDTFWGVCKGKGKNVLGRMLQNIRDNDNNLDELMKLATEIVTNELV